MSEVEPAPPAPHPSTAGWGAPEPPGTDFDADGEPDGPAESPAEPAWPAEGEPGSPLDPLEAPPPAHAEEEDWPEDDGTEADGWDEDAPPAAGPPAVAWTDLEDEARTLPPGVERLGRRERARISGLAGPPLLARLDTGRARSALHAEVQTSDDETVAVRVGDHTLRLPRASEGGPLAVRVTLHLAGVELPVALAVHPPSDGEPLVLGCDVLAGRFVIDPAVEFRSGAGGASG